MANNTEKEGRYLIMRGEMAYECGSTNNLEEAKAWARSLDDELTSDEWDNCENHWVLDSETDTSIEIY